MERIDQILHCPLYRENLEKIRAAEAARIYCGHDMDHFLDVARVLYIQVLEKGLSVKKDVVYAIGLLHDIGRGVQYETSLHHDTAGRLIAEEILPACGYDAEETSTILEAMCGHSQSAGNVTRSPLGELLYEADHMTRRCFACKAYDSCHWDEHKKNKGIRM